MRESGAVQQGDEPPEGGCDGDCDRLCIDDGAMSNRRWLSLE